MRDYMQIKVRQKIAEVRPSLREKFERLCPQSDLNQCEHDLPDEIKDCVIQGNVTLGENSKLYGCFVGAGVDLEVGDNTIIYASIFGKDGTGKSKEDFYLKETNGPTKVHIGSNCMIDKLNCLATTEIGDDSIIIDSAIKRDEPQWLGKLSSPIRTGIKFGKETVLYRSRILQLCVDHANPLQNSLEFGDGFIMLRKNFETSCKNVHIGKNLLISEYLSALSWILDAGNVILDIGDPWHSYLEVMNHNDYRDTYVVHLGKFKKAYIGDNVYIGISMKWLAAEEDDTEMYLGDGSNIVSDRIGPIGGPEYKAMSRKWIVGKNCTLCCMSSVNNRSESSVPCVVKVNDGLNVGIRYDYDSCPIAALHIAADGYYNI